ncbi:MAG: helix-turn-helix transcriptional regulator [Acutalibacteraceae bacterium]
MNVGQAVRERIAELCEEKHITINKLANISGITQSTLDNIMSGRNNSTTISTIQKICDGLEITVTDFFDSPLFLGENKRLNNQKESLSK